MPRPRSGPSAFNPNSKTSKALARRTLENLTPKQKAFRDRFVEEFVRDWDPCMAWIRAGGPATTAQKNASCIRREPYVAQKIQEVVDHLEEQGLITKSRVLAGLLREANYHAVGASHGARVSAWMGIAKIKGFVEEKVNHSGKVGIGVMVVPMPQSPEEWERMAEASQKQLKEKVKE